MIASKAGILLLLLAQAPPTSQEKPPAYPPVAEVRESFLKMLDRPRVALDPQPESDKKTADLEEERLSIATQKKADGTTERVPMLIVRPTQRKGRLPVVIVLHGTGGSREGSRDWLTQFARRGIIGVAIDGRYHGLRGGKSPVPINAYNKAIIDAWHARPGEPMEHPFYYDTCWDVWRTIDYLQTRDDIDPEKIGLMGISKGGIETWLAGAVDPRVKVAVPAIGVQSFRWSLDNDRWQARANTIAASHQVAAKDRGEPKITRETCRALWGKVIPGILDQYDCPSMLRMYAGRPLLIVNGENDPNCPLDGAKIAFASAEEAFKNAGAADKLAIDVARGSGHTVTPDQHQRILDWFSKWLKD